MDRGLAILLTVVAGGVVALQAPLNSGLAKAVGTWQGAFLNFAVGTAALAVIVVAAGGGFGGLGEARTVPWYYVVGGGLCGVVIVTSLLLTVRTLGNGPLTAAVITGQLGVALVLDQYGWLGVDKRPITVVKVIGLLLLAVGTYLIVRD